MKKVNGTYFAKWYGGIFCLLLIIIALAMVLENIILIYTFVLGFIGALIFLPGMMKKKMEKSALAIEKEFPQKGFFYQYKFTAHNGIFYIDVNGRLGVVWKHNPSELYLADLSTLTDIHVHDGKQLRGTSLVSCQFKLGEKKYKIYTLRVSNGQLSMKAPEVLEAISKADKICEMLKTAKQSALGNSVVQ